VVYQESVLHLLHPCSQIFQKNLNREASFWIIRKLGSNAATTIGVASTCLLRLFARQQKMSYRRWFVFLDHRRRTVLRLVLLHQKRRGQTELKYWSKKLHCEKKGIDLMWEKVEEQRECNVSCC
jgi:hypothetical protein